MSAQHTPGPWFNTSEDDYPTGQVSTSPLGSGDICVVYNDNAKADARLIAAAPMLLEALQHAKDSLVAFKFMPGDNNAWEDHDEATLRAVDAALDAATGSPR